MPETTGRAVFLSYASQDAEAARRICETLRAAGVEVWFDQNELVGGDAWDAKIRKQIQDCTLFVPIISAATQARGEGYFRLEWKLAVDRSHLMAHDQPFLLPVVIDATPDASARVPPEFRAVQWTRLPGGETSAAFSRRVITLLAGEAALDSAPAPVRSPAAPLTAVAPARGLRPLWLGAAGVAVAASLVALLLWSPWQSKSGKPVSPGRGGAADKAPHETLTEAQQFVAKARKILTEGDEVNRETYLLAEDLVKRAVALDPSEPTAWALYAELSYWMAWHGFDDNENRRGLMRRQAERARTLAPDSVDALITSANVRTLLKEDLLLVERDLLALAQREPANWRVQRSLGMLYRYLEGRPDEMIKALQRARELSQQSALTTADLVNVLIRRNRLAEAEALLGPAIRSKPSGRLITFDVMVKTFWRGDFAGAAAAIAQWPAWLSKEDRGAFQAWRTWMWSKEPAKALRVAQELPRDYLFDSFFAGPRAVLTAQAHENAGHVEAARTDWQTVVQQTDRVLLEAPEDAPALYWKAWALARLGDKAGAVAVCRQIEQRNLVTRGGFFTTTAIAPLWAVVGQPEKALEDIRSRLAGSDGLAITRAQLEHDPAFESLRGDPRFRELIPLAAPVETDKAAATAAPEKSVAVLAFANLSTDKDTEYFSDGVSEELLNVLAKVPDLKVSARTSAFSFKGRNVPIPEIARQLGVAYVVEGSVRKMGSRVRITAKLIKAADGFQVWSDNFVRELQDVFAVQDEIAGLIAENLSLKLAPSSTERKGNFNPEAYRLYLEGRQAWALRNRDGFSRARELFKQALALDPNFARAMVGLADVGISEADPGAPLRGRAARMQSSTELIQRALQIEPDLSEAYATRGIQRETDWDFAGAESDLRKAVALNPNNATAHQWLGRYLERQGLLPEGIASIQRAAELDPLAPRILDNLACLYLWAGRNAEALTTAERVLAVQPNSTNGRRYRAEALWRLGRRDEALAESRWVLSNASLETSEAMRIASAQYVLRRAGLLDEAVRAVPLDRTTRPWSLMWLNLGLGRHDAALELIDHLDPDDLSVAWWGEMFDPIRGDPRFRAFLQKRELAAIHERAQQTRTRLGVGPKP